MSDEITIKRSYVRRGVTWIKDTLLVTGIITWFLLFGGARLFDRYFDCALLPIEAAEAPAKPKK